MKEMVYSREDIVIGCLGRLPPNWWYVVCNNEVSHPDEIWSMLPFNYDFFMLEMKSQGLVGRNALGISEFNEKYRDQFELSSHKFQNPTFKAEARNKKWKSATIIFIRRIYLNEKILHLATDQVHDVAERVWSYGSGIDLLKCARSKSN